MIIFIIAARKRQEVNGLEAYLKMKFFSGIQALKQLHTSN
jgi:hypothetical protein